MLRIALPAANDQLAKVRHSELVRLKAHELARSDFAEATTQVALGLRLLFRLGALVDRGAGDVELHPPVGGFLPRVDCPLAVSALASSGCHGLYSTPGFVPVRIGRDLPVGSGYSGPKFQREGCRDCPTCGG